MALSECAECKWKYPHSILSPLVTSLGETQVICGQCALELTNRIHGIERRKFDGPIAEHMRLLAIKWRKKNSKYAPK
jgi:hypothetical protein